MTGFDIKNAMTREYDFGKRDDSYWIDQSEVSTGLNRIQRFIIVLMMAMKGSV